MPWSVIFSSLVVHASDNLLVSFYSFLDMAQSLKDITMNFYKLDKFEREGYRRWQKKMHFYSQLWMWCTFLNIHATIPQDGEEEILEMRRKRTQWENDDYICRGHILNSLTGTLFDLYQNVECVKELCDALKAKYISEYASSNKFSC